MIKRPPHLLRRTFKGKWFSEEVVWIHQPEAMRNFKGESERGEKVEKPIRCVTSPPFIPGVEALKGKPRGEGMRIAEGRMFYHMEKVDPVEGDIFVWSGSRYRVRETTRWGGYSSTFCERMEEKNEKPSAG